MHRHRSIPFGCGGNPSDTMLPILWKGSTDSISQTHKCQIMDDTLLNDRTSTEETSSPSIAVTSNALPEAVAPNSADGSDTGVSLRYVHDVTKSWYVFRATYGRERKAYNHLIENGAIAYLPVCKDPAAKPTKDAQTNEADKPIASQEKLLIPSIVFAYVTAAEAEAFIKGENHLPYLHYYYDRTQKNNFGKNLPLLIKTPAMDNFIQAVNTRGTKPIDETHVTFKTGDIVRVTDGVCKGLVGKVGRIHRQTGLVIELEGLCCLLTAYVPERFLEWYKDNL